MDAKELDADTRMKMNDALCSFSGRWTVDGDYLRCAKCNRPHIASKADMDFEHQAGCENAATSEARPWRALLSILAPLYATPPSDAAQAPDQARYIVIGYGESDHPVAAFVGTRDGLLDSVLGMIYTHPSDANEDVREAYRAELADDDEWSGSVWRTEFEIGGIVIYDLGYAAPVAPAAVRATAQKWSYENMVAMLRPAWEYIQEHQDRFNAVAGQDKTKILVDTFMKHVGQGAAAPGADHIPVPVVIDRSHPNEACVTLGFADVEACDKFLKVPVEASWSDWLARNAAATAPDMRAAYVGARQDLAAIQSILCEVDPHWRYRGEFGVKPREQIIAAIRDLAAVPQAQALTVKQRSALRYAIVAIKSNPGCVGYQVDELEALLASAPTEQRVSDAERDVLAERARQVSVEGWTPTHDDQHGDHQMSCAAGCYAMYTLAYPAGDPPPAWPWAADSWKPTTHRRNLIKAGALILAEIERIDRAGGDA